MLCTAKPSLEHLLGLRVTVGKEGRTPGLRPAAPYEGSAMGLC